MKNLKMEFLRLMIFLILFALIFFELVSFVTLVDYMGQYIAGYDPEYYLYLIVGLSIVSLILNYLFIQIQNKNSWNELVYLQLLAVIYIIFSMMIMLLGVWLFGDYRYDYVVYWGTVIITFCNIILNVRNIRRNYRFRYSKKGKRLT
ncbi:hypothetical protein D7M11_30395 [Paenibacillus ginsengarvi]|uniref:Uncharacterized protein n=1 Tax=Paenibacillus ginsengarvi TaxID=400777 RepID=A0A3B0BDR0_9BACL|nr:hypothetical protein D7M11_30395 [Paenibacillus ginsengarvi]